jgi:hypothetical protein
MVAEKRKSIAAAFIYGILPSAAMPRIKRIPHMTEERKTNNLAIAAAPAAMSVLPNTAAASAITKKMPAHRSIDFSPPQMIRKSRSYCASVTVIQDKKLVGASLCREHNKFHPEIRFICMKKSISILASLALLAACEQKETTVTNPPAEQKENKTTVVNPPVEKKESHTTVVNPPEQKKESNTTVINPSSPATETKKEKTEVNINTSPAP